MSKPLPQTFLVPQIASYSLSTKAAHGVRGVGSSLLLFPLSFVLKPWANLPKCLSLFLFITKDVSRGDCFLVIVFLWLLGCTAEEDFVFPLFISLFYYWAS